MLLGIIVVMAVSVALFLIGLFVPARLEAVIMGLSCLLLAAALSVLVAAYAMGYRLTY